MTHGPRPTGQPRPLCQIRPPTTTKAIARASVPAISRSFTPTREVLDNPSDLRNDSLVVAGLVRSGFMDGKQLGFGDYERTTARKRTKRERFLAQMEALVPWKALIDLLTRWRPCCGSTLCSSGTSSATR